MTEKVKTKKSTTVSNGLSVSNDPLTSDNGETILTSLDLNFKKFLKLIQTHPQRSSIIVSFILFPYSYYYLNYIRIEAPISKIGSSTKKFKISTTTFKTPEISGLRWWTIIFIFIYTIIGILWIVVCSIWLCFRPYFKHFRVKQKHSKHKF